MRPRNSSPVRYWFSAALLTAFCNAAILPATAVDGADDLPTDNPVATFYDGPEGYPAWTDRIHWDRAINMKTYAQGKTALEKYEHARDELAILGGGVLYYPAGTYDFSDMPADGPGGRGLMLRRGVVIRGESPRRRTVAAKDGQLELRTRFVFGFKRKSGGEVPRDWNLIGLAPEPGGRLRDVDDVGICHVQLVGAVVYFGPDMTWGNTWKTADSWLSRQIKPTWADRKPDGAHPADPFAGGVPESKGGRYEGAGSGRLVFGCQLDDAVLLADYLDPGYGTDGFHTERFCGRISVYGSRVLVANNLIPASKRNFVHRQQTAERGKIGVQPVLFDYANTPGIDVNKDLLGLVRENGNGRGYCEEGVVVRDNYVFNHGGKGYNLSGKWLSILTNHDERRYLRSGDNAYGLGTPWVLTLNGYAVSGGASDNLSRAFDLAGRNLWIDGNTFNNCGSDPGNDGEGILCQLHGGTHIWSWAATHNRYDPQQGEPSYIGGWDVHCLGLLIAFNHIPSGWVGNVVITQGTPMADCALVANACQKVNPNEQAGNSKRPDALDGLTFPLVEASGGKPSPPTEVSARVYQVDAVAVTWTDAADNEIGFRVERQIDGGRWQAIAYRPPRIQGTADNPQAWTDFTVPPRRKLAYRVVAINARDNDDGASAASVPLVLDEPSRRYSRDQ